MTQTLAFAARQLSHRPGWTMLVTLVLALALGSAIAVYAIVDGVLFRPLAAAEPERLVRLFTTDEKQSDMSNASYPWFRDLKRGTKSFDAMAAYMTWLPLNVARGAAPAERASGGLASGEFFGLLGARPALGRLLGPDDDAVPGAHAVAVLGWRYWQDKLDADPGVLGSSMLVNGHRFTVVGVTSPDFRGAGSDGIRDVWLPMAMAREAMPQMAREDVFEQAGFTWLDVIARLAPGVSLETAQAEATAVARNLPPHPDPELQTPLAKLVPAQDAAVDAYGSEGTRRLSWLLVAGVFSILVIGCANVMGLLLVRSEERQQELAIRLGLGATPGRVVRQLLLEGVVLAFLGAVLGIALGHALVGLVARVAPQSFAIPLDLTLSVTSWRVVGVALLMATLATLLSSLWPALVTRRIDISRGMHAVGRGSQGVSAVRFRTALLTGQIALSVVLLCAAALLLRTLAGLTSVDTGYDRAGVVAGSVDVALHGYDEARGRQFHAELLQALRSRPGVLRAALAKSVPVNPSGMNHSFEIDGYTPPEGGLMHAHLQPASPDYFAALGVPLLRGRDFGPVDTADSEAVVIVSRSFADAFWPAGDAVGKTFPLSKDNRVRIVGVAGDMALRSLQDTAPYIIHVPTTQFYMPGMSVLIRTRPGAEQAALATLRETIAAMDPGLPVYGLRTLDEQLGDALGQSRLVAGTLTTFGVVALVLSAAGVYGLFAYLVRVRRREIGLRIALGATQRRVLGVVMGQGVRIVAAGILFGLLGALLATRAIQDLLYEVPARDAWSFALAALLVAAVATVSVFIPARAAARTDPQQSLRTE